MRVLIAVAVVIGLSTACTSTHHPQALPATTPTLSTSPAFTESSQDMAFMSSIVQLAIPRSPETIVGHAHEICAGTTTTGDVATEINTVRQWFSFDDDGARAFINESIAAYCPTVPPLVAPTPTPLEIVPSSSAAPILTAAESKFAADTAKALKGTPAFRAAVGNQVCDDFNTLNNIDPSLVYAHEIGTVEGRSNKNASDATFIVLKAIDDLCADNSFVVPPKPFTLKVFGNGSRSGVITWSTGFDISQATDARIPWSKSVDPNGNFYQVSAQDDDGTSITCEILDSDGNVLDENTSTGRYAIASCTASP